jgi:hypothetical protein
LSISPTKIAKKGKGKTSSILAWVKEKKQNQEKTILGERLIICVELLACSKPAPKPLKKFQYS